MKNLIHLFIVLLFISCENKDNTTQETSIKNNDNTLHLKEEQLQSFDLSVVKIQEKNINQTLTLNGIIEVPPQNLVSISTALGGYVKSTKLIPGMIFRKGEIIAELEDNQYIQLQEDYLTTKAQLLQVEAEYERQKSLNASKASSDKVYQQAKSSFEILLVNKKALEEKLRLISINPAQVNTGNLKRSIAIYAPFNGFVSQAFVHTGEYVSPATILFELIQPKDLLLNLKVFEKDWDKLKIGQAIEAFTNSNPTRKYKGQIAYIGKSITEDRTMNVYATFQGSNSEIIPGMYMNAAVTIPAQKTSALPEESILKYEGKNYVFERIDTNTFKMMEVKRGSSTVEGWVEIENASSLQNKNIVQQGAYTLLMALKNTAEEE